VAMTADPDALRDYYQTCALAKPEPRKRAKDREKRTQAAETKDVRAYVFSRERNICRCCNCRPAGSMHEITFRSKGKAGKPSRKNSIAVCGKLVGTEECCHTYLQQHQILVEFDPHLKAEGELTFHPQNPKAREWMKLGDQFAISSSPRVETEHL